VHIARNGEENKAILELRRSTDKGSLVSNGRRHTTLTHYRKVLQVPGGNKGSQLEEHLPKVDALVELPASRSNRSSEI
jgi:hypothetical protein